jgi:hypothetical protein
MTMRALMREKFGAFRAPAILPADPRHDDLYLVEFPKSGVTWLSYLMANTGLVLSGSARRATFFNLNELVADVHFDRRIAPPKRDGFGFRCIKSHAAYTPHYKRVFYLVRDPCAVMASYFIFATSLGQWRGSLEGFVRDRHFGISAWMRHVNGWLDNIDEGLSFGLLRYEDMLADTREVLRKIYKLLGVQLAEADLERVIAQSSIERMREDEALFNDAHLDLKKFNFVRKENVGGSRIVVSESVKSYIDAQATETMRRVGYRT